MTSKTLSFHQQLRFPTERRTLWITFATIALVIILAGVISFGGAVLLVLFIFFATNVLVRLNHRRHVGNALRIGKSQFPEQAVELAKAAKKLKPPPLQAFIYQEDHINAYAFGWDAPQAIVITSGALESLDKDEFRFLVGHEMGHIALGHTRLASLVGGVLGAPHIPVLSTLLTPVFLWWSRSAEYSADRAGLIACGDVESAISALLKLLVGPLLANQVDAAEVIAQSQELRTQLDASLGEAMGTHPFLVHRVNQLIEFWRSDECQTLIKSSIELESNAIQ
jgi:Zn-dependent protease with chaperone function